MAQYAFFKRFLNITSKTVIEFSVGMVEGVLPINFSSTDGSSIPDQAVNLVQEVIPDQQVNFVEEKAKNILRIGVGGAIAKTTPLITSVILGATPNLLI